MPKRFEPHIAYPKGYEASLVALASDLEKNGAAPDAALKAAESIARKAAFAADPVSLGYREGLEIELITHRGTLDSLSKHFASIQLRIGELGQHGLAAVSNAIRDSNYVGPIDRAEGVIETWGRLVRDLPSITSAMKQLADLPKGKQGIKYNAGAIQLCIEAAWVWHDCVGAFPGKVHAANGDTVQAPLYDALLRLLLAASGDNDVKNLLRKAEYDEAISRLNSPAQKPSAPDA